jgi:hypothetical protein
LMLHCASMSFSHPTTTKQITLRAQQSSIFEQLATQLNWKAVE